MTKLLNKLTREELDDRILFSGYSGRWFYQVHFFEDGTCRAWRQLKKFALTDNRWCKIKLK